jgi:6,7-dimethyl-8-ribityllumazine synthase
LRKCKAAENARGCAITSKGIGQVAAESGVPVSFGVLTCNTLEQAIDRAGAKSGNKGFDAAMAAIEMANLMRQLRQAN